MPKKKPIEGKPEVHDDLKGLEIQINEFGEIISNTPVNKLNNFLDKNVKDKKLVDRDDYEDLMDETEDEDDDFEIDEETQEKLDKDI